MPNTDRDEEENSEREEASFHWGDPGLDTPAANRLLLVLGRAQLDIEFADRVSLPDSGQVVALADDRPKTAALCYDRVWSHSSRCVPDAIRCFADTDAEVGLLNVGEHLGMCKEMLDRMDRKADAYAQTERHYWRLAREATEHFGANMRRLATAFTKKTNACIIPVLRSFELRELLYQQGQSNSNVVYATLVNLEIVDEAAMDWEQVKGFREDLEARRKYRRLLHWLDKEMLSKSQHFIEDEIACRLDDYEWALRKHGIETILGTVSEAIDGKYLLGGAAVGVLASHPILGAIAGGLIEIAKVGVRVAQTWLDLEDTKRGPNSEVSWVYEAARRLGKKPTPNARDAPT